MHRIKRSIIAGLTLAAAAVPSAAQAWVRSAPTEGPVASAPAVAQTSSGFQWGDAGIGAGAAVVVLGVGALGTGATRRRRQPVVG